MSVSDDDAENVNDDILNSDYKIGQDTTSVAGAKPDCSTVLGLLLKVNVSARHSLILINVLNRTKRP